MAEQFPPLSIDNPPPSAVCGCDCGCRRRLNQGNAMGQELESEYDAPTDNREILAETSQDPEPKVIWHADPDTINPDEWANAPVVLLICAACFVGEHKGPTIGERRDESMSDNQKQSGPESE